MITLRPLRQEDVPAIKSWPPYPREFGMLDYSLRDGGWLDEYGGRTGTEILIAEDGNGMIGFALLAKKDASSAEFRIALHPLRLGQGLGRTVALRVLARGFSATGCDTIVLIVRKNNPRAERLYESLRFRPCGECMELVNGENVPFLKMEINRKTFEGVIKP
ncbi:MAG: N-acetyltransferase [Methanoregula sp.]|nr:MAG: N-acetyltransferase [Methanoregula sp.]